MTAEKALSMLQKTNFCFLFAQKYHSAMKYVGPIRKELGFRTVFNILGPLTNPAKPEMFLLGVYDEYLVEPIAKVLASLGVRRGIVAYGREKLDEISPNGPTVICEIRDGYYRSSLIRPEDFGLVPGTKKDLLGGTPEENARVTRDILSGRIGGTKRNAVLLNAGAAFFVAQKAESIKEGITLAASLINSGKALTALENIIKGKSAVKETAMILDTLADAARERTRARQKKISFAKMRHLAESLPQKRAGCFQKALQAPGLHIIAEVKKASPSKGLIAPFFPYETIAETYEKSGASAISVLTEPTRFLGKDAYS